MSEARKYSTKQINPLDHKEIVLAYKRVNCKS